MGMSNRILAATAATAVLALLPAGPALAHTEVGDGDLRMIVGFGTEPAYSGQPNSVEVLLTLGGRPVTDLRPGDLQVEVRYGDASTTMDLEPNFVFGEPGDPGDYRAWFVPSEPGEYTFRITGTVDGQEIDEEVTSGPNTFSEVTDVAEVTFPQVQAPSNEELATRIERESSRTSDALAAADALVAAAEDDASSARMIAMIAIAVGAIGAIAGIAGIATARTATARRARG